MRRVTKQQIFVVDDEPNVRKVVARTLEKLGVEVRCFAGAAGCLRQLACEKCDLLITDVRMPKMDGIKLLAAAKRIAPWLPVLVITGYGDIALAVRAMRNGAADFIEKPLRKKTLCRKVESILKWNSPPDSYKGKPLTRVELKVLRLTAHGKSSKEIAQLLDRSIRTIEDHRSHIMRKLAARNVVEMVERAIQMGLVELPPN
jgi:FixJ family two-component response regulator